MHTLLRLSAHHACWLADHQDRACRYAWSLKGWCPTGSTHSRCPRAHATMTSQARCARPLLSPSEAACLLPSPFPTAPESLQTITTRHNSRGSRPLLFDWCCIMASPLSLQTGTSPAGSPSSAWAQRLRRAILAPQPQSITISPSPTGVWTACMLRCCQHLDARKCISTIDLCAKIAVP